VPLAQNFYNAPMKIALIGADGQLGTELLRTLSGHEVVPLYFPDFDVTRPEEVRAVLSGMKPEAIVNTSAFHRVDECEDKAETAFRVNAFAVRDLALLAGDLDATLVHVSTDYVFDGRKAEPYLEDDPPFPLSVYGASKLSGEYFVRALCEKHLLVRTCGLYGPAGCREKGLNFVEAMLRAAERGGPVRVVDDQWVTPTSAAELAAGIADLLLRRAYGLFHMTNEGRCTWFQFARAIFDLAGLNVDLRPIDTAAFGARARRPAFSVLENGRAKAIGIPGFSEWRDALRNYLGLKGTV
jgi:dTDP-4-dehydrorhamnose reductase